VKELKVVDGDRYRIKLKFLVESGEGIESECSDLIKPHLPRISGIR